MFTWSRKGISLQGEYAPFRQNGSGFESGTCRTQAWALTNLIFSVMPLMEHATFYRTHK